MTFGKGTLTWKNLPGAGSIPIERAHNLREVGSGEQTMRQELERIGYLGTTAASYKALPIAVSGPY